MLGLLKWISKSYREAQIYLNSEFKEYGINATDYVFLKHLCKDGGINQETIAKHLSVSKTASSKIVKKLIDMKLVRKERGKTDKREYNLYLTLEGKELREKLNKKLLYWEEKVFKNYSEDEREECVSRMKEIYKITEELNRSNYE